MKVDQNSIIRWVAKLVSKGQRTPERQTRRQVQTLDNEQLRQVSGGTGGSTQGPNKGW